MTRDEVLSILKQADVLLEGHFVLASGKHSEKYMQCAKIFRNTKYAAPLCAELAAKFADDKIDVVVGPAMGAVQMAYEVSRHLGCENFFTERDENGDMQLRRGFTITKGMRVLLVEDVITTGGTVMKVGDMITDMGGVVVGLGSIVDRLGGKQLPIRYESVIKVDIQAYEPSDCPACKQGIPIVKPGSSKS